MGTIVHGRKRDGVWQYRLWSAFTDTYVTAPMDAEAVMDAMRDDYTPREVRSGLASQDMAMRLDRVHTRGSSYMLDDPCPLDGPWETERCPRRAFHHAFELRASDGLCASCGEPAGDHGHEPECRRE